jgi:alpha-L-arabinofuranosidase
LAIEGAFDNALLPEETIATFVDVTAVMPDESTINISLINRSPDSPQKIKLKIPEGFIPIERWVLEHKDINAANTSENRENIIPQRRTLSQKELSSGITVLPCGFTLIRCQKADNP